MYESNKAQRQRIDNLLRQAARLFMNCKASDYPEAKEKEKAIIAKIAEIDEDFARRCGYKRPKSTES